MDDKPTEADIARYNEMSANIQQMRSLQWQIVIVSVAMLVAVPTVVAIPIGATFSIYIKAAKIAFCVIAGIYACWHVHRYQLWLTFEREQREAMQRLWLGSGDLHKKWGSMHAEKLNYWFDWPALVSWWLIIICTGLLSILNIVFS